MYIAVEIVTAVVETVLLRIYLKGLYQSTVRKPHWILITYAIFGAVLCTLSLLPINPMLRLGCVSVLFFIVTMVLFGPKWYTAVFSSILLTAIFIIVDIVGSGIMALFNIPVDAIISHGTDRVVFIILAKLIQFFCVFLVIRLSQWRKSHESLVNAVPLLLCQVFSIFICYFLYLGALEAATTITVSFVVGAVGILYINIVIFLYVERIKEVSEIKKQNALAEQLYSSKLEYFQQVRDDQAETRALWHDIKKYLNTMNDLMNRNDIAHARECIGQVSELFEDIGTVVDVGNTVVSAVLNHSVQKARRLGIDTDLDVRVKPGLNISAADLSVIVGNTFDNAIEAVTPLPGENRRISIRLFEKGAMLYYEIANPYDPAAPARKKDAKQHGFGLKNARRCVDKYKGTMTAGPEGGEFLVSVHLNIPSEEAGAQLAS